MPRGCLFLSSIARARIDKPFVLPTNNRHAAAVALGVKVRRGARWALGVGVALIAMAAGSSARADVRPINLDGCSGSCVPSRSVTRPPLRTTPRPASPCLGCGGGTETARTPVPIRSSTRRPCHRPWPTDCRPRSPLRALRPPKRAAFRLMTFSRTSSTFRTPPTREATRRPFFLFTPSLTSRLSDFLWASNDFFGPPSGGIASRRGVPLSADADYLTGRLTAGWKMRTPASPDAKPFAAIGAAFFGPGPALRASWG